MSQYHVLHEGRRVGPYDKRTIVGMRIRQTLTPEQMLVDDLGRNVTVAELMAERSVAAAGRQIPSSGWPKFAVRFVPPSSQTLKATPYSGEGEIRLQEDIIRVAGSSRGLFGTRRHGRVKLPIDTLKTARLSRQKLELWFEVPSADGERLQVGALAVEAESELALADLINQLPVPVADPGDSGSGSVSAQAVKPAAKPLSMNYTTLALVGSVATVLLVIIALAVHLSLR